jgi:hypothetical protein
MSILSKNDCYYFGYNNLTLFFGSTGKMRYLLLVLAAVPCAQAALLEVAARCKLENQLVGIGSR